MLPRRSPASAAPAAIAELRPWIERRLREAERRPRARSPHAARRCPTSARRSTLRPEPGRTRAHRTRRHAARARRRRARAPRRSSAGTGAPRRAEIAPRLDAAAAGARHVATRSCRSAASARAGARAPRRGAMSFNWRLLLAPEPVLDYVVWHEACHLRVMDHSPRFWALVRRHCPDYEDSGAGCGHGATLVCDSLHRSPGGPTLAGWALVLPREGRGPVIGAVAVLAAIARRRARARARRRQRHTP